MELPLGSVRVTDLQFGAVLSVWPITLLIPNDSGPGYVLIDKISTSPVALDSPANAQGTSTGHTYSATLAYDGSNLTLNLYDVTAGGACRGPKCFTNTWNNVNIPSWVGGNTAWVGFTAATGGNFDLPALYWFVQLSPKDRRPDCPDADATPTFSPAAGSYTSRAVGDPIRYDLGRNHLLHDQRNCSYHLLGSVQQPKPVDATETLQAIAVATGDTNSGVASAPYTITAPGVGSPMTCLPLQSVPGQPGTLQTACTITLTP